MTLHLLDEELVDINLMAQVSTLVHRSLIEEVESLKKDGQVAEEVDL
jgi:hypothetical protein